VAHHKTSYWFRYADNAEALTGLPLKSQASFYASAIVGLPRNLVGLLRSNLGAIPTNPSAPMWNHSPLDYAPQTSTTAADVQIYADATKAAFHFGERPLPAMQLEFIHKISSLAQQYHTQLVLLSLPDFADHSQTRIEEDANWPEAFGADLRLVGIAPATLFRGLTETQIHQLYYNATHFNQNGQNYFTPLITPSLIQIYEKQNHG
jgi:hypothetical protein